MNGWKNERRKRGGAAVLPLVLHSSTRSGSQFFCKIEVAREIFKRQKETPADIQPNVDNELRIVRESGFYKFENC
jgi:hypothetical protein